jgi:Protein of unknown function (DUF2889)
VATATGTVEGGLEDDLHYFTVTVRHDHQRVQAIESHSVREPWSTCADAAAPLRELAGMPLSERCLAIGDHAAPLQHCTHQFDLAGLAVAHAARVEAGGPERRQYDIEVPFGLLQGGERAATLERDGTVLLQWTLRGHRIVAPEPYAGVDRGFFRWADEHLPVDDAEAAIVMRRACTIGMGRGVDLDQYDNLGQLPELAPVCYSMQPERAPVAFRYRNRIRDFDDARDTLLAQGPA